MKKYLFLTGAGISAESGIRTFRDTGGLWEEHRVEDVASPQGFEKNPHLVWDFYKERYLQIQNVEPNAAHFALKKLEDRLEDSFHLITQNVDGLHYRAGSKRVLEMHGSLNRCYCTECRSKYEMKQVNLNLDIPECSKCGNPLRPDIVWFGEVPYSLYEVESLLKHCDVFVVIGTSGTVYPAAGFVMTAKLFGARTIAVNLHKPDNYGFIDDFLQGKSGDLIPKLVDSILGT